MAIAGSTSPSPVKRLKVLIVEDSLTAAAAIEASLRADGMETERAANGNDAIGLKNRFGPDVVLIDLELPDVNGMSLVEHFSREGDCGVIVVTAHGEEQRRIAGLEIGADDYIVKPPVLPELAARIRAVHRRLQRAEPEPEPQGPPSPPVVSIDAAQRCLLGPGSERTLLTEAELAALETLLDADGASVSREWLSRVALKRPLHAEDRSVDQLVLKLRRKLATHTGTDRTILSARRQGYVIPDPTRFKTLPVRSERVPTPSGG
jgi:DNA-binding response OmpR family regulator